jgi:uncharacterized Zn finger protein
MAITKDTSAPPPPATTRVSRGLELHRARGHEIESIGKGVYRVPGCSGGVYEVNLAVFGGHESCDCPDRASVCKHLIAATIHRAKAKAAARRENTTRRARRGVASRDLLPVGA